MPVNPNVKKMSEMYLAGKPLKEVGEAFGVPGERVRQLLAANGVQRRPRGHRAGPSPATERAVARDYLEGVSREDVAAAYGLSVASVARIIHERLSDEEVRDRRRRNASRRSAPREYADWELVEALTSCASDLGPKFTAEQYAKWRAEQGGDYPSVALFNQRRPTYAPKDGASWNGWRKLAGLPTGGTSRPGHSRRYDADAIYGAIDGVASGTGSFPTVAEYEARRPKGAPSAATIRLRYGRWGDVRDGYDRWKSA